MPVFALTIFIGAFLLFQVQPLIGRYILPWFGGGTGIWTACLLFFQALLLGGYAYAHFSSRWLKPRHQATVHLVLLAMALALLPITPADAWKPTGNGNPTLQILALLTVCLGLPYFVLSATGPLMQHWFSCTHPGVSPYRLYALSNAGSLLALISYPIYFETHFTRTTQARLWGWGLAVYAVACGFCVVKLWRTGNERTGQNPQSAIPNPQPSTLNRLLWLLLPACASVLLMATTNKICQDVAVIPFLWVLPLALYLLSFIICFDNPRWYARFPFTLALVAASGGICWAIFRGYSWPIGKLVTVYAGGMFVCCMVCHGELYRLRPDPRQLTGFYLMIAAGGALGGLFVAVIAPMIFTGYYELHIGVLLCALLFLTVCLHDRNPAGVSQWRWMSWTLPLLGLGGFSWLMTYLAGEYGKPLSTLFTALGPLPWMFLILLTAWAIRWRKSTRPVAGVGAFLVLIFASWVARKKFAGFQRWQGLACSWLAVGVLALGTTLWLQREVFMDKTVYAVRNFYGVLRVLDHSQGEPPEHILWLRHGHISHGCQLLDPVKANWPTTYYSENSGVGLALRALPAGHRRIGVVGLGVGILAAYGRAGDSFRFYEINPEVERIATSRFTFLTNCPGKVEITPGDARLSLEREPPQDFDLLVLDAFNSDAIPLHLLTVEAFEVYNRHLKTNGVIAIHISNNSLDLEPVAANLARHFNYQLAVIDHVPAQEEWWVNRSIWVLLAQDEEIINTPDIHNAMRPARADAATVPLWTDDFSSLFQVLK
jgi:SAM-dependent methyltransferase